MQHDIERAFRRPVVPVLTIDDPARGVDLAAALAAGGLDVLEITLRTPAALAAIEAIALAHPAIWVGVGSVNRPADFARAADAGARFAVSPGVTEGLLEAARKAALPWLPAAATVSESMRLLEQGVRYQKLFPASVVGGTGYLDAIRAPLPEAMFCPTGGLGPGNAGDYLSRTNVVCVGGSWVAPEAEVAAGDWDAVRSLAAVAAALPRAWPG